jgi:hypothetical protein
VNECEECKYFDGSGGALDCICTKPGGGVFEGEPMSIHIYGYYTCDKWESKDAETKRIK